MAAFQLLYTLLLTRTQTWGLHPVYRLRGGDSWNHRCFDRTGTLPQHEPVIHVNWYEARAYCRWAVRILPTEAERKLYASGRPPSR